MFMCRKGKSHSNVNGENRQVYGAKLRGPHTKENVNRGVSAEKPELHSNSKENIAHI